MMPLDEDSTIHAGGLLNLDLNKKKKAPDGLVLGIYQKQKFDAFNFLHGLTYSQTLNGEGDEKGLIKLNYLCGASFKELMVDTAASFDISNQADKYISAVTFAAKHQLNKDTSLKIKLKDFDDLDFSVKTKICPEVEVTFCAGMEI